MSFTSREMVCRDGAASYAEGIRQDASHALTAVQHH